MKREADAGAPMIPLSKVQQRVSAATGISLRTINRIAKEGREIEKGEKPSFSTPNKIRKNRKSKRRTVKRWILRSQLGELDIVRPGAAWVINADQNNAIVEMADNSRFISAARIRKTLELTCSLETIRRRLHENS
ncbi:hypothetical protein ILUMI_00864 [Ignelater luminosus]|uniref:Uncharacterized protein n=1 Tax=Ignelater luminosus TaxID=2038154 RepID=A0A8K0GI01_IGNLU|nr:hypothetical protein ILUMI_00864 [Ignelater luminosus]